MNQPQTLPGHMRDVPARPSIVRDIEAIEADLRAALEGCDLAVFETYPAFGSGNGWNTLHRNGCGRTRGRSLRESRPLADEGPRGLDRVGDFVWSAGPGGFFRVCNCATRDLAELAPLAIELKWAKFEQAQAEQAAQQAAAANRRQQEADERAVAQAQCEEWARILGVPPETLLATAAAAQKG